MLNADGVAYYVLITEERICAKTVVVLEFVNIIDVEEYAPIVKRVESAVSHYVSTIVEKNDVRIVVQVFANIKKY